MLLINSGNSQMTKRYLVLLLTLFLLSAPGCGSSSRPDAASLSGKITYKNNPVTGGNIIFHTESGGSPPWGINSDGTFTAADLPLGNVEVTIDTEVVNPNRKTPQYGDKKGGDKNRGERFSPMPEGAKSATGTYVKIPARYSVKGKSGLTVTLTKGRNQKDFELTD
jgi:hypothetical protein